MKISHAPLPNRYSKVGIPVIVVFSEPVVETITRTISEVLEPGLAVSFLTISEGYRSQVDPEHPRFGGQLKGYRINLVKMKDVPRSGLGIVHLDNGIGFPIQLRTRTYPNTLGISTIEHLDEVLAKASELGEIGDILCSQVEIREINEVYPYSFSTTTTQTYDGPTMIQMSSNTVGDRIVGFKWLPSEDQETTSVE